MRPSKPLCLAMLLVALVGGCGKKEEPAAPVAATAPAPSPPPSPPSPAPEPSSEEAKRQAEERVRAALTERLGMVVEGGTGAREGASPSPAPKPATPAAAGRPPRGNGEETTAAAPAAERPAVPAAPAPLPVTPAPLPETAPGKFHVPSPMTVKQSYTAELWVDPRTDEATLESSLRRHVGETAGTVGGGMVEVSPKMKARLEGPGDMFRIEAESPEVQDVSATRRTVWQWSVVPLQAGHHQLTIVLLMLLPDGSEHTLPSLRETVDVLVPELAPVDQVIAWAKKLAELIDALTALVVAAVGLLAALGWNWARKRQAQKREPDLAPPPAGNEDNRTD